ncbi:MAG: potassium transporter TrkA [Thermoplasmata archaeon]|nr:potassium transporter TrkA [Thermoplasmata archaeon]
MTYRRRRLRFQEIEYEPRSVRDLLTEMKDTSELAVDLAYAAAIFDSREMAQEVERLGERMDVLLYQITLSAMLAARNPQEAEELSAIIHVANAAEKMSNAALDIIRVLETDVSLRRFLPSAFYNADEKTRRITIAEGSSLANRTLGELNIEAETGVRVIAVRRKRRWVYDPPENFVLRAGDLLVVIGVDDGYEYLRDCAEGRRTWGDEA